MATEQISDEERGHIVEEKHSMNKKAMKTLLILLAIAVVLWVGVLIIQDIYKKEDIRFAQFDSALSVITKYETNSAEKAKNTLGTPSTIINELNKAPVDQANKTGENLELLATVNGYNKFIFGEYRRYFSSVPINKLDEGNIKTLVKDLTSKSETLIARENELWDMFEAGGFSSDQKIAAFYTLYLPDAIKYESSFLELNAYLLDLLHSKGIYFPTYVDDLIYVQQNSLKSILTEGLTGLTATNQESGAYSLINSLEDIKDYIQLTVGNYTDLGKFEKDDTVNTAIVAVISACTGFNAETKFTPLNTALAQIVSLYDIWN